ncbi:hypothetical protein B0F90DRAFT_1810746 [Multifurca ochricompacta]|uniref:Sensor domain-containing protein n=1 Tax=Multifurca ochricompacta TaxID=376703 RepID=A0AAD4M2I2_9AGAM|nr:hypothetical protein B0F90DRAFT_1810746 [Multifurca ochricompacta]
MSPEPPVTILSHGSISPPQDPPPPYPSRDRRHRRRRTTIEVSSADSEDIIATFPDSTHIHHVDETTPLLGVSSPTPRTRTMSLSSAASISPSLAQTVVSAFRMDLDSDAEDVDETSNGPLADGTLPEDYLSNAPGLIRRRARGSRRSWRHYFRPISRRAYWSALLHLLFFNFPYALLAWVYLFVFTLLGTILLVALPLGAVLCFFDLLGARALACGEVALQSTFHGPLAYPLDDHVYPIFTRLRMPTPEEVEAGLRSRHERSFYRNSFSMFTDPTSYQALFYFLVIKPGITILLSVLVIVLVPISLLLIIPTPAMLRLVRKLGIWQANVAVEGLYLGGG